MRRVTESSRASWAGEWALSKQRMAAETQTGALKLWLTSWQHASFCQITSFLLGCDCWSPSQSRPLLLLFFTQLLSRSWQGSGRLSLEGYAPDWSGWGVPRQDEVQGQIRELLSKGMEAVLFTGCFCAPLFFLNQISFLFILWLNAESLPLCSFESPGHWGGERISSFFISALSLSCWAWGATG